jgi:hypothetical protein
VTRDAVTTLDQKGISSRSQLRYVPKPIGECHHQNAVIVVVLQISNS